MARRMSCSLTVDAVRERRKTVTRRHIDTWWSLSVGDHLTLIEKGMGLPKGSKQVVLAEVEVMSVTAVHLAPISADELEREGFPGMDPHEFVEMWLRSHGYGGVRPDGDLPNPLVRRIAWRYLAGTEAGG